MCFAQWSLLEKLLLVTGLLGLTVDHRTATQMSWCPHKYFELFMKPVFPGSEDERSVQYKHFSLILSQAAPFVTTQAVTHRQEPQLVSGLA